MGIELSSSGYRSTHEAPAVKHAYVAGIVTAGIRRHLVQTGEWERVAEKLSEIDPDVRREIEDATAARYTRVPSQVAFIEAIDWVLGPERVSKVGRDYVSGNLDLGFLSRIIRGWVRSFAGSPAGLLRVCPHLWRASFRNAGRVEVGPMGPGYLVLELRDAPDLLITSSAWVRMLHGACLGLLELYGLPGDVELIPQRSPTMRLDIRFTWAESASG